MTHESQKLLEAVLQLPKAQRLLIMQKLYESIDSPQTVLSAEQTTAKSASVEKSNLKKNDLQNKKLFDEMSDEQNKLIEARIEKMNNGRVAYLSVKQLHTKIDLKLKELNLN
jgi:hypothetical protein